jgi:pyruvate formate lyase activating enzyme
MGTFRICWKKSPLTSRELELCLDCIRCCPEEALEIALKAHARIRSGWELPGKAPRHSEGIACDLCVNRCLIGEGGLGYCGLRKNVQGRMEGVSAIKVN